MRTKADLWGPLQIYKFSLKRIVLWSAVAHDFGGSKPPALPGTIPDLPAEASPGKKNISVFPKCKSL